VRVGKRNEKQKTKQKKKKKKNSFRKYFYLGWRQLWQTQPMRWKFHRTVQQSRPVKQSLLAQSECSR
jgi:hypothetical protein